MSPLCESFLRADQLRQMEPFYPLHVFVCERCSSSSSRRSLRREEIFTEYAYFSSYSTCWVEHARHVRRDRSASASVSGRTTLSSSWPRTTATCCSTSSARAFRSSASSPLPTSPRRRRSVASRPSSRSSAARRRERLAGQEARSLVVGNNVLAQVPDLNDFVAGVKILLATTAPRLSSSRTCCACSTSLQYDTIYHEHFSYFSLATSPRSSPPTASSVYDVEELCDARRLAARVRPARGRPARDRRPPSPRCCPRGGGRPSLAGALRSVRRGRKESKRALLELLIALRREGRQVVGYGAPGKANTLLNYCASAPTCSTTPSTATPTSTGASRPARTSRSTRRR